MRRKRLFYICYAVCTLTERCKTDRPAIASTAMMTFRAMQHVRLGVPIGCFFGMTVRELPSKGILGWHHSLG
jgi:hypothetical protein